MAKTKTAHFCQGCGAEHGKWMGQCSRCGEWNTIVEEVIQAPSKTPAWQASASAGKPAVSAKIKVRSIRDTEIVQTPRQSTNDEEFDRVLGGGIVAGSVVLIGGETGIGKSTLM